MSNNLITDVFKNRNSAVPVWFLRQAGRHIPEYFEIRENEKDFITWKR